ncbi:MAG: hypothetical protein PHQ59_01740 [Candidatus Daviesbacteria bacterium]|nr:hypothetical protein [Candidatus Daviesbacteria bacterium]
MGNIAQVFEEKSLVVVFAYVAAGLGHLRITDALLNGLPDEVDPLLFAPEDALTTFFHRLTSVNPLAKNIFEWSQNGNPEEIYTRFFRWLLRSNTDKLYNELSLVYAQRTSLPKTVLIVSTHFGMALQFVAIKKKFEQEKHVKLIIVMQVTDDSPQNLWYVPGIDMTFVPSEKTKKALLDYGRKNKLPEVPMEVFPYPVDPLMEKKLTEEEFTDRVKQMDPEANALIHLAVPVSGAAVGMTFLTHMVDELYDKSNRFTFHIISKSTPYTQDFLKDMINRPFVKFEVSFSSREIIDKYVKLYENNVISLEMTKPSEQSFKSLFCPVQKGGTILLFSEPVGRQEFDNLDFLRRHHFIPLKSEMEKLWQYAEQGMVIDGAGKWILEEAKHWRGLILPQGSKKAAAFIWWCLQQGILKTMIKEYVCPIKDQELGSDGVERFWQRVAEIVEEKA